MKELFDGQKIIPAAHNQRDIEKISALDVSYMVMLETHVAQVKSLVQFAKSTGKKVLLHADLINGLKNDDYAIDFICQEIRPDGIISTRGNVILKAKQHKVLAIQRLFMIDSSAYSKGMALVEKVQPDAIELLPGILPEQIAKMDTCLQIPIIAGGLIERSSQIDAVLAAGATAITTSNKELWKTVV
ncbi:glycerol uptake responsive antiterminator [Listeria fleischmannii 1991]|uniref:Glycerol uptake operon antiterminator regulatory protein n=2 Tax=Listeria fleischmannii TaxID=1069827 RepID=A0A2X3HLK0_9LIST|nr:glycerol-3-phosphate responsive antiterminator [Listeria fleischmannii]EMG26716.1 glycerol uptake responsive antiterminator [Listeria fleischmannii subsp. fleischmannii LU2006-1]KMT60430.1 glycerol uptake responsive antiterminator [Listeria fleischmannii 1991]SQC72034.1 Glycerol-3-phosphate responsive antiterminator [Listeria fleischmannii subsp. fleischmannii]